MKILALSSSRAGNSDYLQPALPLIENLFGSSRLRLVFIPFASVGSYGEYHDKVVAALQSLPHEITLASHENVAELIGQADGILIGGGNTFKLLKDLQTGGHLQKIRERVRGGMPYVGWSAGSNILAPTIRTTNDMPITEPQSFDALGLFPFQINPHYFNQPVAGFNGETRDQRLTEFLTLNQQERIVAIPEGTALLQDGAHISFMGNDGVIFSFRNGEVIKDTLSNGDLLP